MSIKYQREGPEAVKLCHVTSVSDRRYACRSDVTLATRVVLSNGGVYGVAVTTLNVFVRARMIQQK